MARPYEYWDTLLASVGTPQPGVTYISECARKALCHYTEESWTVNISLNTTLVILITSHTEEVWACARDVNCHGHAQWRKHAVAEGLKNYWLTFHTSSALDLTSEIMSNSCPKWSPKYIFWGGPWNFGDKFRNDFRDHFSDHFGDDLRSDVWKDVWIGTLDMNSEMISKVISQVMSEVISEIAPPTFHRQFLRPLVVMSRLAVYSYLTQYPDGNGKVFTESLSWKETVNMWNEKKTVKRWLALA